MPGSAEGILGSLRLLVDADTSKAQKELAALGGKSKVAMGAVGSVIGIGLAEAANGGAQLSEAVARFTAETGATQEEADAARKSIVELFTVNPESMAVIGETLSSVTKNLGLQGDAAKEATQQILDYAKATSQDAVGAVESFDDIIDSWGLNATEMADLMDRLLVSNQKFGGTIEDSQRTLAALAPAMKAANLEIGDGIELLNLFGAKGLDANSASAAFAKALTKVKSPQELQDLIDDISNTEDPFLRASKAADLFGARAGAKLANALGGVNLDDFGVSADEAAGAVERAADAIDNTPLNWLTLQLRKVQGPLADFGAGFGPVLLAISSLAGPGGIRTIGAAIGGLGGVLIGSLTGLWSKVGPVASTLAGAAGTAAGAAYTAATFVGSKLLAAALAAWAFISGGTITAATASGVAAGGAFVGGFGTGAAAAATGGLALAATLGGPAVLAIAATAGEAAGGAFVAGAAGGAGMLATIARLLPMGLPLALGPLALEASWDTNAQPFQPVKHADGSVWLGDKHLFGGSSDVATIRDAISGMFGGAIAQGVEGATGVAVQALSGQARFDEIFDDVNGAAEEAARRLSASGLAEAFDKDAFAIKADFRDIAIAIKQGFGSVKAALAKGDGIIDPKTRLKNMRSRLAQASANLRKAQQIGDPIAIDRWEKGVAAAQGALLRFQGSTGKTVREVGADLAAMGVKVDRVWGKVKRVTGEKSKAAADKAIRQANRTKLSVSNILQNIAGSTFGWGEAAIQQYAMGIASAAKAVGPAVGRVAQAVYNQLHQDSPAKEGPLSKNGGTKGWGEKGAALYAEGWRNAGLGDVLTAERRSQRLSGARGGRGEDGGTHIHIHGNVYGGQAGLRQLASDVERAVRPTRRERRRKSLAEG